MNDCAILILSCDKYSDLWIPFFKEFRKKWPDCPFKVYLGSNTKSYHAPFIKTILSGPGKDWSSDLLAIIHKLKEKYIFIWLDDFFPISKVDTNMFIKAFKFMENSETNLIHFAPLIRPVYPRNDTFLNYYEKGTPYRVIACGFWNTDHIKSLLIPGENPWKFEIMGSYRSSYSDGYYTLNKAPFQFLRVVEKGLIGRRAYKYCLKHNIVIDISVRPVESVLQKVKSDIIHLMFQTILVIPWRVRVNIMEMFRKIFVSY